MEGEQQGLQPAALAVPTNEVNHCNICLVAWARNRVKKAIKRLCSNIYRNGLKREKDVANELVKEPKSFLKKPPALHRGIKWWKIWKQVKG